MGRAYRRELGQLNSTISWADAQDVTQLCSAVSALGDRPLISVGSGGSLVAAEFAAKLHEMRFAKLGSARTPLDAIRAPATDAAALLVSARGSNADIVAAFNELARRGYGITTLTTRVGSTLGRMAAEQGHASVEFDVPTGRDGFLATNSLVATLGLLYRAYLGTNLCVSSTLTQIRHPLGEDTLMRMRGANSLGREATLIVLYEGWSKVAALDLESRFSEAALGNVSLTDFRNFAHGRHYWLHKHPATTLVVSLETPESQAMAERTLHALPEWVPVQRLQAQQDGPLGALELVQHTAFLAAAAGDAVGSDPGRPAVPEFGRRLYRAGPGKSTTNGRADWAAAKARAIGFGPLEARGAVESALTKFVRRLHDAPIKAVILDYDGTLTSSGARFSRPAADMANELNRLLDTGIRLGIATGRGRSVVDDLREVIEVRSWPSVTVGMYNGARIIRLDDESPASPPDPEPAIREAQEQLRDLRALLNLQFELRGHQLSIFPVEAARMPALQTAVRERLQLAGLTSIRVMRSTHSLDLVSGPSSKSGVVSAVAAFVGCAPEGDAILRIGDHGGLLGNDFDLLASGLSLSVDQVSSNLETCWNLSPRGLRGPRAALAYLNAITSKGSDLGHAFNVEALTADKGVTL